MTITASSVTIVIVRFIWLSFAPGFRFLYFSLNCIKSKCMKAWIRTTITNITVVAVTHAFKESLPVYSSEKNKKFSSSASTVLKVLWSILTTIACLEWMNAGFPCCMAPMMWAVRTTSRGGYWGRDDRKKKKKAEEKKKKKKKKEEERRKKKQQRQQHKQEEKEEKEKREEKSSSSSLLFSLI